MSESIGRTFMEKTKYAYMEDSDQMRGIPQPPLELEPDAAWKSWTLPSPQGLLDRSFDFNEILSARRSLRKYSAAPLSQEELSYLLWCTQGVQKEIPRRATFRTVPSAGARHAFETYLLINRVEGLEPGIYHYQAIGHKLQAVNLEEGAAAKVTAACLDQSFVAASAVTFLWGAVLARMKWRYGERGYRYLHLDAGHICQNLYLAAGAINSGVCAIAAFSDDEINSLLGMDGMERFIVYIGTVGKK